MNEAKLSATKSFHRMMSPPPSATERDPKAAGDDVGTGRQFLWSAQRIHDLEQQLSRAVADRRTLQQERIELEDRLIQALSDFGHVESERRHLDDRVQEAHAAMRAMQTRLERIDEEIEEREGGLKRALEEARSEAGVSKARAAEQQAYVDELAREVAARDQAIEDLTGRVRAICIVWASS